MKTFPTYICVCVIIVLTLILVGECQICRRYKIVQESVEERYVMSYIETYKARCIFGNGICTKMRRQYKPVTRPVTRHVRRLVKVCCSGYIKDETSSDNSSLICIPICVPICENGYCQTPGVCACNDGYVFSFNSSRHCEPVCQGGCENGVCASPNTCECNFGYTLNEGKCQPICSDPCVNANCTAPDTCECHVGYRKSENNTCEPYCSQGCINATCVQPETCECNRGYKKDDEQCIPECSNCTNGTCVAPETCLCNPGYELQNGICMPLCNTGCGNGTCVAPDTCECHQGYENQNGTCTPICDSSCLNGECVAPEECRCNIGYASINNTCEKLCKGCENGICMSGVCNCNEGYKRDVDDETCIQEFRNISISTSVEPDLCKYLQRINDSDTKVWYCEGTCVDLFTCDCGLGFEAKHAAADGGKCDCIEDCLEGLRRCQRTKCYPVKSDTNDISNISTAMLPSVITTETVHPKNNFNYINTHNVTLHSEMTTDASFESIDSRNSTTVPNKSLDSEVITKIVLDNNNKTEDNLMLSVKMEDNKLGSQPLWVYIAIPVCVLILATVVLILVAKRKSIMHHFKGGSYIVKDNNPQENASVVFHRKEERKQI